MTKEFFYYVALSVAIVLVLMAVRRDKQHKADMLGVFILEKMRQHAEGQRLRRWREFEIRSWLNPDRISFDDQTFSLALKRLCRRRGALTKRARGSNGLVWGYRLRQPEDDILTAPSLSEQLAN